MAPECFGAEKSGGKIWGKGTSVRVAMVTAIPMTLEGSGGVKGLRLQYMVQLSLWRPCH